MQGLGLVALRPAKHTILQQGLSDGVGAGSAGGQQAEQAEVGGHHQLGRHGAALRHCHLRARAYVMVLNHLRPTLSNSTLIRCCRVNTTARTARLSSPYQIARTQLSHDMTHPMLRSTANRAMLSKSPPNMRVIMVVRILRQESHQLHGCSDEAVVAQHLQLLRAAREGVGNARQRHARMIHHLVVLQAPVLLSGQDRCTRTVARLAESYPTRQVAE